MTDKQSYIRRVRQLVDGAADLASQRASFTVPAEDFGAWAGVLGAARFVAYLDEHGRVLAHIHEEYRDVWFAVYTSADLLDGYELPPADATGKFRYVPVEDAAKLVAFQAVGQVS